MPKSVSPETLLKRLQKIERAQGRLGDITGRIRVQAETLSALLKEAQAFVDEKPATKPAGRPRTTAPAARTRAKKATAARPARPAKAASTRRASRKPASG